ncbi:two-component sensor histidine kinase [Streptomyces sulfonofaciens]|uniref:histidine kinase n=1 Tax=Streptomyces sulfonofaciens TaxID=68272 RepID=A0A919FZ12_9ACTN|nr:histidine kinase [Streptomyces sulfonofaciens]GHH74431.1 two-component sensor histidine kinase [Streptomyces sulfonofaciens]
MRPLTAGQAWLRTHPSALDAAVATGVLICMTAGSLADPRGRHGPLLASHTPDALSIVLMVLGSASLVFRRRAPLPVLAATGAVSLVELLSGAPRVPVAMCAVVALYTVAATTDRPTTWRVGLLTGTVLTTAAMLAGPLPWYAQENIAIFAWTGMAAAAGDAVRSRRAFVHAIRERAERAERTREEEARRRVAEERLRIARDLHDVVAHHIALVNVQAGVAAHVMDKRPDQAKEALAHVREASRTALGELRATVGLLRQSGDPAAPTEPAPGLDRLDELVETFRSAGLPVRVARSGHGPGLPAAVDLAAYRILQEALTNVHKHAGAGAGAEVSVLRIGDHLELTVLDTGPGPGTGPAWPALPRPAEPAEAAGPGGPDAFEVAEESAGGGGHGLIGMRERATALGGSCTAGPRYGGGFRVHAILPVTARAERAGEATGDRA